MPLDSPALATARALTQMRDTLHEIETRFGVRATQAAAGGFLDGVLEWMENNTGSKSTFRDLELRAEEVGRRVTDNYKKMHRKGDPST